MAARELGTMDKPDSSQDIAGLVLSEHAEDLGKGDSAFSKRLCILVLKVVAKETFIATCLEGLGTACRAQAVEMQLLFLAPA